MYPLSIFNRTYIVDNFYTTPNEVRKYAINQEKENTSAGQYAGVMTNDSFITEEHLNIISQLVGHQVQPTASLSGKFRFTKKDDTFIQDIHFDPSQGAQWAGVCYLTPNVEVDGTYFWRHNKTGLESIPLTQEGISKYGWNKVEDLKNFLETDGLDHSLWTKTLTVSFKYNRLIIFRPWLFHSPGPSFGDTYDNCRLIQTFFF